MLQIFVKICYKPDIGSRRQDFEDCYINGAIYSMTKLYFKFKTEMVKNLFPLIMDAKKSINIDEKFDLKIAELLIKNGDCNNKPKTY